MAYLRKGCRSYIGDAYAKYVSIHTSTAPVMKQGSAGIIIIGDEILKGSVADTNSHFIAKHLFDLGIKVSRISIIGDVENEIAEEVKLFSKTFSYVITTGGIGPTHDDVTFLAVANAFGEKVVPHPELVKICAEFFQTKDLKSPAMKLAHVPESAKLTYGYDEVRGRRTLYPNVSVRNVYIFPGIPSLMERLFLAVHKEIFKEGREQMYVKNLYLGCSEVNIADHLNVVVKRYPNASFGSYPKMFNRYYQVQITIHAATMEESEKAFSDLLTLLPKECIVNFDDFPNFNAYQKILNFSLEKGKRHVKDALKKTQEFCKLYRPSEICVIFNGDPESVVMLHLLHGCLRENSENAQLNAVSFLEKSYPPEVEQFIQESQKRYYMKVDRFSGPLDVNLKLFIESEHTRHNFKTVFFGCITGSRSSISNLLVFEGKNHSPIQWINPIKEWTSADLWDFIHSLYLPYNALYNSYK